MFDKTKLIASTGAAFLGCALLASPACAQSASLYGGGAANVGVGAGGGGGTGMDPAGGGPGVSGGTPFGRWNMSLGAIGGSAPAPAPAAAPATGAKQGKKAKAAN